MTTARSSVVLAVLTVAIALVAGCGIASDDSPRPLALATTSTEPPSVATSGGTAAVLYFVRDGKLVPVTRSLPDRRVGTVLNALVKETEPDGIGTAIPQGSSLREITTDGDSVVVDLSPEFENVVGPTRQQALAQLVLTATEFPDVNSMSFMIDGEPLQVTSPTRGDTTTVNDCDFASLLPTAEEAIEVELPVAAIERLNIRRQELESLCPAATTRTTR